MFDAALRAFQICTVPAVARDPGQVVEQDRSRMSSNAVLDVGRNLVAARALKTHGLHRFHDQVDLAGKHITDLFVPSFKKACAKDRIERGYEPELARSAAHALA